MSDADVVVVGAGPSGLTAALTLARAGVDVLLLEAGPEPGSLSRASTFHPPTLDLLDHLGAGKDLIARGRVARRVQYRDRHLGVLAEFDMGMLAGRTGHPYRLQAEQRILTGILAGLVEEAPTAEVRYGVAAAGVRQDGDQASVALAGGEAAVTARYVIGADGAHSVIRDAAGIDFSGETYEMRYLTVTSSLEFDSLLPDLAPVTYMSGGGESAGLLALCTHWRAVFRIPPGESDADAVDARTLQQRLRHALSAEQTEFPVEDAFIYRVHRRLASSLRAGRVLLAGDAAHLNSPSGGMGMNSGIHDAYLAACAIVAVIRGEGPDSLLDHYSQTRRAVARDVVGRESDRNYRAMVEPDLEARRQRGAELARTASDPASALQYLIRASMLDTAPRVSAAPRRP